MENDQEVVLKLHSWADAEVISANDKDNEEK
jgi:hypothetical protein